MASEGTDSKCQGRETPEPTEEAGVSMVDVLEEETQLEEDANAVLGGSDDKNCTYLLGYIPRQALYACATCTPPSNDPAAICLACSYECHEGHELIELYTKRNVRCDCGNSRFPGLQCKLCPNKQPVNEENRYNQNYRGQYCTCHRPYPDPDDSVEDEMIQCVVCEDWLHGRHLEGKVPVNEEYEEMICQNCVKKYSFLLYYALPCTDQKKVEKVKSDEAVEIEAVDNVSQSAATENKDVPSQPQTGQSIVSDSETQHGEAEASGKGQTNGNSSPGGSSSNKGEAEPCLLADLQKRSVSQKKGALFWPQKWRAKLCLCQICKAMYQREQVSFLTDQSDTVHAYEQRGKERQGTSSGYDQGLEALSSMNRVQQVEVIQGYNDMRSELRDYLKKFADNGKVVREEDIREFFSTMEARKRQRVASSVVQWTCK